MSFLLAQTASGWYVSHDRSADDALEIPSEVEPAEVATLLAEKLDRLGYRRQGVLLGLASGDCLSGKIETEGRIRPRDRQKLLYALEEPLPVAAEDLAADFVLHDSQALGVAVEVARHLPLIEALEEQGIVIQSVVPLVLLAAQQLMLENSKKSLDGLLWQSASHIDLLLFQEGKPIDWRLISSQKDTLHRELGVLSLQHQGPLQLAQIGLQGTLSETLEEVCQQVELEQTDTTDLLEVASLAATHVLSGKRQPWIELRRGQLGATDAYRPLRRSLQFTTVALILFLACLSGALLFRAQQFQSQTRKFQTEQQHIFQSALPKQKIPRAGIRSRLKSEASKLSGLTGNGAPIPEQDSVMNALRDVIDSLPTKMRFRLFVISLSPERLHLTGEVRKHADADRLAAGLRDKGFQVEPPRTHQLSGRGVEVTIDASFSTPLFSVAKDQRPGGAL